MQLPSPFAPALVRSAAVPKRDAGGDNTVERDGNGRPRILVPCSGCQASGKIPSTKVVGRMNKCPKCKGDGQRKVSYTRVTTFIDALEDKETLMTWKARMVLIGAAMDTGFLKDVVGLDYSERDVRDMLNRRAEAAADLAGANERSEKGTFLHALSEMADNHEELPLDIDPEDWLDIKSYTDLTHPLLRIVHMEQLVVNDLLKTAGTPDRVSSVIEGAGWLVAPDGHVLSPDELVITDLKTGRVDYGGLKMAMQLAIYARSHLYDKETGERVELGNVNKRWGLIMNLPAGSGETTLYWADLELGWEAVLLASEVRDIRRRGRGALTPVTVGAA